MSVVEAKKLKKRFGKFEALRDVTFTITRGSTVGFLGPNGSGKTTTIKVLIGLLRRDGGDVSVLGMDPWKNEVEVRRVTGVLHERPIYPAKVKVLTLLKYLARLRGYGLEEVNRVAKLTGIEKHLEKKVASLSRGYLQRLGLAQALLGDPELLLLDEPTANLDPLARVEILRLIKLLKKELEVSVLISSHILPELEEVCDYAVFISEGITLDWGKLDELAERYGALSSYFISAEHPRGLAKHLITMDYVYGIDLVREGLIAKIKGNMKEEFMSELERIEHVYGVKGIEPRGSELGDMYEKVIRLKSQGD